MRDNICYEMLGERDSICYEMLGERESAYAMRY